MSQKRELEVKIPIAPTYVALMLILAEGKAHAWAIKNILEERGFEEWVDMKKSTIYKSLSILERKGFIKGTKEESYRTPRKVYEITTIGRKELDEQIQLCLSNPPKPKTMFDLGLAGLFLQTKSSALSALMDYKNKMELGIQWFEFILHQFENLDKIVKTDPDRKIVGSTAKELIDDKRSFIVKALFERPYYTVRAQKKWLERFIQSIKDDQGDFEFKKE
ncbi:MAG: PadR family transcriptional regulator [Candidatus Hodarchaeales archaeon]